MTTIVTHPSPDADSIGAVWALKKFHPDFSDADVRFVSPTQAMPEDADAIVDVGGVLDPSRHRYDHHQLANASEVSATYLVAYHLDLLDDPHVAKIVDVITDGDGRNLRAPVVVASYEFGFHAFVAQWRSERMPNEEIIRRGCDLLDTLYRRFRAIAAAVDALERGRVFTTENGKLVFLVDAPSSASFAAFERGAEVVVYRSDLGDTVAVGAQRAFESTIHLGRVVDAIAPTLSEDAQREVTRWFRHPAGFMSGRGSERAPNAAPCDVEIAAEIAHAIARHLGWE